MNAMIRGAKGALAVVALVGVGLGLRWMTDGAISGMRTYDLESMTVLVFGTVAWMAYGWFVLAVLMTVLEQIPGAIGALAGAVIGRITSKTARTLLRSGLGVAAVTPLTVGVAHATPGGGGSSQAWTQVEPRSTVQLTDTTTWRTTEPGSTVHIAAPAPGTHPGAASSGATDQRATEPGSTVDIPAAKSATHPPAASSGTTEWRATEPGSQVHLAAPEGSRPEVAPAGTADWRASEPPSTVRLTEQASGADPAQSVGRTDAPKPHMTTPTPERPATDGAEQDNGVATPGSTTRADGHEGVQTPNPTTNAGRRDGVPTPKPTTGGTRDGVPGGGRVRVGVPDRPAVGAATRYTDLRSGVPVRVPGTVVVQVGDSLWSLAAAELGPGASAEAVAARWPEWYAANRQVIGADPDLILPGQVLRIPAAGTGHHVPPTQQEK